MKVQVISDISCILLYYSLTTLLENQTLGEEYVGVVQVDPTLKSLPSRPVISTLFLRPLAKLELWFL